jgi:hypothetical protein
VAWLDWERTITTVEELATKSALTGSSAFVICHVLVEGDAREINLVLLSMRAYQSTSKSELQEW